MTTASKHTRRSASESQAATSLDPSDDSPIVDVPDHGVMTQWQRRFAEAYFQHGNGTLAAREAGYAGGEAELAVQGSRLLRNPKVR